MKRPVPPPPPAPPPTHSADETEARFYAALRQGDLAALMALWAEEDEVVCVHPGGARLVGTAAIRASFEGIFSNGGIPITTEQVHRLQHAGFALHHLVERITVPGGGAPQLGWVMATNLYHKTPRGWRIAAHHASPGLPPELAQAQALTLDAGSSVDGAGPPTTLH